MGLKDIGAALPPGYRFCPNDEELVCHYLYKKIDNNGEASNNTLIDIDLYVCEPWMLPDVAKLNSDEWYFFSFRGRKYATGYRISRATATGYWKATGKDRVIKNPKTKAIVGMRKTLVFYRGRAPNGIKTNWIMHEFRIENPQLPPREDWVLCRIFEKTKGITSSCEVSPTPSAPPSPTLATSHRPLDYSLFAGAYDHHLYPALTFPDSPPQTCPNPDFFSSFLDFPVNQETNFAFDDNFELPNAQEDDGNLTEMASMKYFYSDDNGDLIFI